MRTCLFFMLLLASFAAHALQSVRVGSQVLVVGDSAARVKALLGEPAVRGRDAGSGKAAAQGRKRATGKRRAGKAQGKGETWQYRREGRTTIFTIVDGKIARIEDVAR